MSDDSNREQAILDDMAAGYEQLRLSGVVISKNLVNASLYIENGDEYNRLLCEQNHFININDNLYCEINIYVCMWCNTKCTSDEMLSNICSITKCEPVLSRLNRFNYIELFRVVVDNRKKILISEVNMCKVAHGAPDNGYHERSLKDQSEKIQKRIEQFNSIEIPHSDEERANIDKLIKHMTVTKIQRFCEFAEDIYGEDGMYELSHKAIIELKAQYNDYIHQTLKLDMLTCGE